MMERFREMIDVLGMECWFLWSYARTHPELTTVAALATALRWGYEETRIRVERCGERGYPLQLETESEAA